MQLTLYQCRSRLFRKCWTKIWYRGVKSRAETSALSHRQRFQLWVSVCLKNMKTSDCYNLGYHTVVRDWDWEFSNHLESNPGFNTVWFINTLPQTLSRSKWSKNVQYIRILTQHRCLHNDVYSSQTIWLSCWVTRRLGDPFSALWSLMVSADITDIISIWLDSQILTQMISRRWAISSLCRFVS